MTAPTGPRHSRCDWRRPRPNLHGVRTQCPEPALPGRRGCPLHADSLDQRDRLGGQAFKARVLGDLS